MFIRSRQLLDERQSIQSRLNDETNHRNNTTDQLSRQFTKLIMEGKVRAAIKLLGVDHTGRPLSLNSVTDPNNPSECVYDTLLKKHPPKQPLYVETIVNRDILPTDTHPISFERIDEQLTLCTQETHSSPSKGLDGVQNVSHVL